MEKVPKVQTHLEARWKRVQREICQDSVDVLLEQTGCLAVVLGDSVLRQSPIAYILCLQIRVRPLSEILTKE